MIQAKRGTRDNPHTVASARERAYEYCRCSTCDVVAICEPAHDFFATPEGKLMCEPCSRKKVVD